MALSGLALALLGPICGAIADAGGRRKPWLLATSAVTVAASGLLWYAEPEPSFALWTLILVGVANTAFELGMVFYNAMLPGLVPRGHLGRLSGWGWACGYAGGLVCLALALFGLIEADPPPFGLDPAKSEPVRAVALMVPLWFVAFGWPILVFLPETRGRKTALGPAVRHGLGQLAGTLRKLRRNQTMLRFLIARMFYIDGLNTLFAFGAIFAAGTFGMSLAEVLYFGVALNVSAGIGAFVFAWIDDWLGPKRTLIVCLFGLLVTGAFAVTAPSVPWFLTAGIAVGVFIGPTQSASRSFMARLAPRRQMTEMFGLFALSGRVTAFAGPILVGLVTQATESQRWGMATIYAFFVVGLVLLWPIPDPDRK